MLLVREALIAARKAAAVDRLRKGYNKEAQQREALQVKVGVWGGGEGDGVCVWGGGC
jgi:hypothetical protein